MIKVILVPTMKYNILLIGETGVGKSTFINSFANYAKNERFKDAQDTKIDPLLSIKFPVRTEDLQQMFVTVNVGKNLGDNSNTTQDVFYATERPQNYEIFWRDKTINFIDTPGVGNEAGISRDTENFAAVLTHLQEVQLHAICFFSKPNISIITPFFDFCINNLLSQFDNAACAKMLFVFTSTRVTDYKALDTFTNLKGIVQKIRNDRGVQIPLNYSNTPENNVFCVDNEGYKYLIAEQQSVPFGDVEIMEESWINSRKECLKLMDYIEQLNTTPSDLIDLGDEEDQKATHEEIINKVDDDINTNGERGPISNIIDDALDDGFKTDIMPLTDQVQTENEQQATESVEENNKTPPDVEETTEEIRTKSKIVTDKTPEDITLPNFEEFTINIIDDTLDDLKTDILPTDQVLTENEQKATEIIVDEHKTPSDVEENNEEIHTKSHEDIILTKLEEGESGKYLVNEQNEIIAKFGEFSINENTNNFNRPEAKPSKNVTFDDGVKKPSYCPSMQPNDLFSESTKTAEEAHNLNEIIPKFGEFTINENTNFVNLPEAKPSKNVTFDDGLKKPSYYPSLQTNELFLASTKFAEEAYNLNSHVEPAIISPTHKMLILGGNKTTVTNDIEEHLITDDENEDGNVCQSAKVDVVMTDDDSETDTKTKTTTKNNARNKMTDAPSSASTGRPSFMSRIPFIGWIWRKLFGRSSNKVV